MKQLLHHAHRTALRLGLTCLLATTLGLSLLRFWMLPGVERYRPLLETHLAARIGTPIHIEALKARLHGFHPEIAITGLNILDPQGHPAIHFAEVRLNLDPFRTLATREPRFERVEIIGPKLSFRRKLDGGIALLGLAPSDAAPPTWLLADGRIALLDAEVDWQDERSAAPPVNLGRIDLRLDNRDKHHRLGADIHLPEGLGRDLRWVLDAEGDLFAKDWQGTAYLEAQGVDAARWAALIPASDFEPRAGTLDAKAWLRWAGGVRSVAGELSLNAPIIAHRSDRHSERQLALKSLAGRFHWQARPEGWRLDLDQLRPALREPWPDGRLAIELARDGEGKLDHLAAAASYLDLGDIATVLRSLAVLDPETTAALDALAPRGLLQDAGLFYAPDAALGERLGLHGRFRDVAFNPWQAIPGATALTGDFRGTDGAGRVDFALGGLSLPRLKLKHPVRFLEARSRLFWRQTADAWWIELPSLSARTPDWGLAAHLRTAFYKQPGASPFVELLARMTEVDAVALNGYLPCALIADTCRWSEQAVEGGRIPEADILLSGFIADYPFYRDEGVFQSELEVEDLKLRFSPEWPPITDGRVHISFRGPAAMAESRSARCGAGRITEVHAAIPDLLIPSPRLSLSGKAEASVADSLEFLAHSPLKRIPERLRRIAEVSGNADIALKLSAALNSATEPAVVKGSADLHRAGLRLIDPGIAIGEIEGLLNFNGEGIDAPNLSARILGNTAQVAVADEREDIAVDVRGRAAIADLRKQFPAEAWDYALGAADYRLNLRFPETLDAHSAPLRIALNSDLQGIALDLPAPLDKPEQAERPLTLEASLQAGAAIPVKLAYGAEVKAQARLSDAPGRRGYALDSADLAIGQPLPPLADAPGIGLYLRQDTVDVGAWQAWWDQHLAEGAGGGTGNPLAALRELSLHFGQLAWKGNPYGPASLRMQREGQRWRGHIFSAYAKGEITATRDLLDFDLESLKIPKPPKEPAHKGAEASAIPGDAPEIDPATIPSIKLRAQKFSWRNADLGPLSLDTERHAHGMIIRNLALKTEGHALELHGDWTRTPTRAASTHLEGKLHIESLGDFLDLVGQSGKVRDTQADTGFALDWPGSPKRFALAAVAGEIKLNLGKGSLLKIEPGLGRMVGMLNLNSLWRRLSFDFSDLFGQGLAYDGIAGTFRLGGGQAITEGFLIDAVSARILVNGRIGLAAKDVDQIVTVIPHTSAALPIAGALAGGPAVGAAVYVAQRLIGEEVDSIAATHYALRGAWEHPAITRINHDYMPLDVLDRAWGGIKDLSGFGSKQEEHSR